MENECVLGLWKTLNSPLTLTVISLLWGSAVASGVAAWWQRRNARRELQFECLKKLLETYHKYIRLVKGNIDGLDGDEFDEIHSEMLSNAKFVEVLFRSKDLSEQWHNVIQSLATIRDLRRKGKDFNFNEKINAIRESANKAFKGLLEKLV